uniref:Pierisin-like domain-containing protein n=1 Tax=Leersia perrieri TaxID=77586 RepID=A0A0D9W2E0_9ORYZ
MRHVFRWDRAPYEFVFQNGLEARRKDIGSPASPDEIYFNLEHYATSGGRPLDTRRDATHAYVSTTISSSWYPNVNPGSVDLLYRYEIYAPGGIWMSQTLGNRYSYSAQDEVVFPAGIAPQYIRSAQIFELTNDRKYTRRRRVKTILYRNRNFNPQSHPARRIRIQSPVYHYLDENNQRRKLVIQDVPERQLSLDNANDEVNDYYTEGVTALDNYIDSAFRSTRKNEAYIFIKEENVIMNYGPATRDDKIVSGLRYIGSIFRSLVGTAFAEHGIDAAFGCHDNDSFFCARSEAMIFSSNLCARINFAPRTTRDRIIQGPKTISQMFSFFKGTSFEKGIDAAFESSVTGEAYLFKGSEYAIIDYSRPTLIEIRPIVDGFKCFRNSYLFARDIGAALASHVLKDAYLFKDNNYVLFHFTPRETNHYIIGGPKEIVPRNWPSLKGILPRKNKALDIYESPEPNPVRDQDDQ